MKRLVQHAGTGAVLSLVGLLAAGPLAAAPPAPSAQSGADLVRAVEKRYASARTLTATFSQAYRSAAMGQEVVEGGRLWVKRPGRMRWDYRAPDKKVFLFPGDGTWIAYAPLQAQATRGAAPLDAPHVRLLLGEGSLLEAFDAEEVALREPAVPGSRQVKLTPRKPLDGVALAYLELDPTTLAVARVLVVDPAGNESDLRLSRTKENADVRDAVFDFKVPPGVEVRDVAPHPAAGPADDGGAGSRGDGS
jgi:outer membrane lipoprotein carrier protein